MGGGILESEFSFVCRYQSKYFLVRFAIRYFLEKLAEVVIYVCNEVNVQSHVCFICKKCCQDYTGSCRRVQILDSDIPVKKVMIDTETVSLPSPSGYGCMMDLGINIENFYMLLYCYILFI